MAGILIVEDERVAAWNIQAALEKFGYTVVGNVASGEAAISQAETLKPDLVLMDIRLPGEIDGIEAAARIRNQFQIPVVYLSAYADDQTLERAIATDPYGYLIKPFKRIELHTTITTALRRCQLEKQLQATQQWLTSTLNSIGDGTIATDTEGRITFMNPVAEAITGWILSEAIGKSVNQVLNLYHGETGLAIENPLLLAMQQGIPVHLPSRSLLRTKSGIERLIDDVATPIRDAFGKVLGGAIVFRDITERQETEQALLRQQSEYQKLQQANQQLEYLAMIDGLTQVANRRRFDEYIQQQWNQSALEQTPRALILCDLDYFKRYNDTYGHLAGDACLIKIARAIKSAVQRPADLVARYGGEEFAVILPDTDQNGALQVAIAIQNQVRQLQLDHFASDVGKYVTVSIGIASTVKSCNSPQALIAAADRALYQAKQLGRDRYYISTL